MVNRRSHAKGRPETRLACNQDVKSSHTPSDTGRFEVISQTFKPESLAIHSLMVPWLIRLPPWAFVTCGAFALACDMLRGTIPQESADRLAWWGYVLKRKRQPRLKPPYRSRKRSKD